MKEAKVTPGGQSRQHTLILAICLAMIGAMKLADGIHQGQLFDYISAAVSMGFCSCLVLVWARYRGGLWVIAYDHSDFKILERGAVKESSAFADLSSVDQDGRGYTIVTNKGMRYRILRKDTEEDLQHLLDSIQYAEQAVDVNRASASQTPPQTHPDHAVTSP